MIKSPAKINLFLHLLEKNEANYHLLQSLIVFATNLYDTIQIKESKPENIIFTDPYKDMIPKQNTVAQALTLMKEYIPHSFQVKVDKRIPLGTGLGGGSSNAGSIIRYLVSKYKLNISISQLINLCNKIGSDVPLFLNQTPAYIEGTGNIITPIKRMPKLNLLIVHPNIELSAAKVYSNTETAQFKKEIMLPKSFSTTKELLQFLNHTTNDLYPIASKLHPELNPLIKALGNLPGCHISRMTGSGSACFGMFNSIKNAKLGLETLQKQFPSYAMYVSIT